MRIHIYDSACVYASNFNEDNLGFISFVGCGKKKGVQEEEASNLENQLFWFDPKWDLSIIYGESGVITLQSNKPKIAV